MLPRARVSPRPHRRFRVPSSAPWHQERRPKERRKEGKRVEQGQSKPPSQRVRVRVRAGGLRLEAAKGDEITATATHAASLPRGPSARTSRSQAACDVRGQQNVQK